MVDIDDDIYEIIAIRVVEKLVDKNFINEVFVESIPEYNIELRFHLGAVVDSLKIVPVWWECKTSVCGSEVDNNFSWRELYTFICKLRLV